MATRRWKGGAVAKAQVQTFTFAGTWEVGDLIRVTIGTKSWDYAVTSATIATFLPLFVAAYAALDAADFPEFAELTPTSSSPVLTFTAAATGKPFTVTLTPLESNAGAADAQTIEGAGTATTGTAATACSGPNFWSIAANWYEDTVPVSSDDVYVDEGPSILYGIDQNAVALASLRIGPGFPADSQIGLPTNTSPSSPSSGYPEYRDTRLKIGATLVEIDTSSRRVRLNLDTDAATVRVHDTGQPEAAGEKALDILGVNASNALRVNRGSVALAAGAAEVSTFAEVEVSDDASDVVIGRGVTLTTLNQSGGNVELRCAATTVTKTGGTLVRKDSGAITTLRNRGGVVEDYGTGTITTLHQGGQYYRRGLDSLTITTAYLYRESVTDDPNGTITWTNPVQFYETHQSAGPGDPGPAPAYANFGFHRKLTVADI